MNSEAIKYLASVLNIDPDKMFALKMQQKTDGFNPNRFISFCETNFRDEKYKYLKKWPLFLALAQDYDEFLQTLDAELNKQANELCKLLDKVLIGLEFKIYSLDHTFKQIAFAETMDRLFSDEQLSCLNSFGNFQGVIALYKNGKLKPMLIKYFQNRLLVPYISSNSAYLNNKVLSNTNPQATKQIDLQSITKKF